MSDIALFHSVLGLRPGVLDAADRLREAGHVVHVVDQYEVRTFDDYDQAGEFAAGIGFPELMRRAAEAVQELPEDLVVAGFSNGGGMAEYVATIRPVTGVLMLSGAMPPSELGASGWPAGVPGQVHYTLDDPFRRQGGIDATVAEARAAGVALEVFDYPGRGHLFTDPSLPDEYDAESAELLWARVLEFVDRVG